MSEYIIMTDSACDLPADFVTQRNIEVIPLTVTMDGKSFPHYPDSRNMSVKDFYAALRAGKTASTAAANVEQFKDAMTPFLKDGKDVIYLGLSSGLTSTVDAGNMAAQELMEEFPGRKVYIIDSLCASLGFGALVLYAADKRDSGGTIDEVRDYIEGLKLHICHWFTVDDLFHLKRGGRVSAATAILGSALNVKPVLHVDDEGHLINVSKVRGRAASIKALFQRMTETGTDIAGQTVYISHGDCEADALKLRDLVSQAGVKNIVINPIGPVIGAHSGPGTLALFFIGTHR
jgi:DegV family protein with EDD domain